MRTKKFLVVTLLLISLCASCAHAKISEELALSDPRIGPYVEFTKQQGEKFLPGRYAHVTEILSRVKPEVKINAPSDRIVEIGDFDSESNAHPANIDFYGQGLTPCYLTLDTSGAIPIMKTYAADDSGEYKQVGEDFAVIMADNENKYAWCLGDTDNGDVRYLFPLNDTIFYDGWWKGDWHCEDGSRVELKDGKILLAGKPFGTYIISDNRIAVRTPDDKRYVIFCLPDPDSGSLTMTFTSGPGDMGVNAGVFTKAQSKTTSKKPTFKAPEKNTAPKKEFPKFPGTKHEASVEGVWEAVAEGQQITLQFEGNNYYGWLNGSPQESGTFQRQGNKLVGSMSNGEKFENKIEFDASGNNLTLTYTNGTTMTFHRVQQ